MSAPPLTPPEEAMKADEAQLHHHEPATSLPLDKEEKSTSSSDHADTNTIDSETQTEENTVKDQKDIPQPEKVDEAKLLPPAPATSEKDKTLSMVTDTHVSKSKDEEGNIPDEDDYAKLPRWRLGLVILSLWIGTLLVAIDTTIISVAIPHIATDFKAFDHVGWYGSAYLFTVTAFQPAFGSIFRLFDAKWTYLACMVIFEAGSVLCAAGPISAVFIFGRAVQGLGAAGLYQAALAIIGLTVSQPKRPMAIGTVLSVFGCAVCLGPPVGGVLTDRLSWRWCFWINLPIGAVAFILVLIILKLPATPADSPKKAPFRTKLAHLDFAGIVLIIGAVCCLVLALQWGGQAKAWSSSDVVGLIVGAALLLVAFAVVQWRKGDKATIPVRVFRQRSILMGALYLFFLEMAIYAYLFYVPFYFQSAQLVSAMESGIRAIPLGLFQIIAVVVCSALVTYYGQYVPLMIAGPLVAIVGNVLLAKIEVDTQTAAWAAYLAVAGIGTGMGLQIPFTAVQVVLKQDDLPTGNAIMVFLQHLGAAISVAVGQNIFSSALIRHVAESPIPIPAEMVVLAGPTGIRALTSDPTLTRALQDSYCYAFQTTMWYALATLVAAIPFAAGMQWLNAKKEAAVDETSKES